jgi:hypothetical protein
VANWCDCRMNVYDHVMRRTSQLVVGIIGFLNYTYLTIRLLWLSIELLCSTILIHYFDHIEIKQYITFILIQPISISGGKETNMYGHLKYPL